MMPGKPLSQNDAWSDRRRSPTRGDDISAALSRSGNAASVQIVQIGSAGEVMTIRATDTAAAPGQNVEPEYWRALLTMRGQIVTLTVLGLKDKPLSADVKRSLLDAFIARVRAVNAG